jgi:hypothetical protein
LEKISIFPPDPEIVQGKSQSIDVNLQQSNLLAIFYELASGLILGRKGKELS